MGPSGHPLIVAAAAMALPGASAQAAAPCSLPATGVGFELAAADVSPAAAVYGNGRAPRLHYRFSARQAVDIGIEIVRVRDGRVVAGWLEPAREPGVTHTREWHGRAGRRVYAGDGRYRFRIRPCGAARARRAGSVVLHGHAFPVRAPHGVRGHVGTFRAPRSGGRIHEGFDIVAGCGRSIVAARVGRVQRRAYDARLKGNYVVIDGRGTRTDYVYAHLRKPSPFARGERVLAGRRIGAIGQTGNAGGTPCHLHFELWPQGYHRGQPADPWPRLWRWDHWS